MLAALLLLQDAAPLPELVESWYRLMNGEDHVGFVHERWTPTSYRRETKRGDGFYERDENLRGLYALRQDGTLSRPGRVACMVVGETERRPYWGRLVRATSVTFDAGELASAWVDRYGRVLEAKLRSGEHIVLARTETEAVGSTPTARRTVCSKNPDGTWHCENR